MALANWADIWGDIWGDIWAVESGAVINDGDEVQVVQAGGEICHVVHFGGTAVRVVIASPVQVCIVLYPNGTALRITI